MRPTRFIMAATATVALLGLALLGSARAQYYPSQGHWVWVYASGETQRLGSAATVRGVSVLPMQHLIAGQLISEDLLEYRDNQVLLRGIRTAGRTGSKLTWYLPPITLYPASPLAPGQSWQSLSSTPLGAIKLSSRVLSGEPVTTPAGKFNALLIRTDVQQNKTTSTQYSYFVPGLGVVRYQSEGGAAVDLVKYDTDSD